MTRHNDAPLTPADFEPGMIFTYEPSAGDVRGKAGRSARVLALRFRGTNEHFGRFVFEVVGAAEGDRAWAPGHLSLDAQTVERCLGTTLRYIQRAP